MSDIDHLLTSTTDDNGWEWERYLFCFASLSVTFKSIERHLFQTFQGAFSELSFTFPCLWDQVLTICDPCSMVLLKDTSVAVAGFGMSIKRLYDVWFLGQGTGFDDLKIPLRTRYVCILSAFLMSWKLGKEKDQNYFIPSEVSVFLKITSIESSS